MAQSEVKEDLVEIPAEEVKYEEKPTDIESPSKPEDTLLINTNHSIVTTESLPAAEEI